MGPTLGRKLRKRGLATMADLLWLLPVGYDDLRHPLGVAQAVARCDSRPRIAVVGTVTAASFVRARGRRALRVVLGDDESDARVACWWFFAAHGIHAMAKPETRLVVSGRVVPEKRGHGAMMAHPDVLPADGAGDVRPRYPRIEGVSASRMRKIVGGALDHVDEFPDPMPEDVARRERLGNGSDLGVAVHRPSTAPTAADLEPVVERLAWAEAFGRAWLRTGRGGPGAPRRAVALPRSEPAVESVRRELGFEWTEGQRTAIDAISRDLESEEPMRRLLQGDVGCGKTAVAVAAAAQAVHASVQAAILAPTTVLAEQYDAAARVLERATRARVALLTGATPAAERASIEAGLAEGTIDVVVGTHALLGDRVGIPKLALVVVDEQQRLGVAQRLALATKGEARGQTAVHLLTLSATPIPRTLALALRGELATSTIGDRPAGRQRVETELRPSTAWNDELPRVIASVADRGERVFVVCPRIGGDAEEDSDHGPGAADRFAALGSAIGRERLVLAHGRLGAAALSKAMQQFRDGRRPVLVGTTVVEVGVDVPEATLMVVDGAEHFGLAQLHQLRGRVGRSERRSQCTLVHDEPLSSGAEQRLCALVKHHDGAEIARVDLKLRGSGDLGGTRQSGDSGLMYLEAFADREWLERIGHDVERIRRTDPSLSAPAHAALKLFVERMPDRLSVREEAG